MEEKILEHLRSKMREMMNERADYISTGSCTDWSDYKHLTGVIEGLALAEREILDIADRLKRAE
jgi:hypothetical protein